MLVLPDQGLNILQRLSADEKKVAPSKERVIKISDSIVTPMFNVKNFHE